MNTTNIANRLWAGLVLSLVVLAWPARGTAQEAPKQYVAINPIGAVFTFYSLEFERALASRSTSIGISTSYWDAGDDDEFDSVEVKYLSVDAKLRYYPAGKALQGLSLGGLLGATRLSGSFRDSSGRETESASALSFGVALDYNWLLGEKKNFIIGTGIGAKRLFGIDVDEDDVTIAYPVVRLVVGFAF